MVKIKRIWDKTIGKFIEKNLVETDKTETNNQQEIKNNVIIFKQKGPIKDQISAKNKKISKEELREFRKKLMLKNKEKCQEALNKYREKRKLIKESKEKEKEEIKEIVKSNV